MKMTKTIVSQNCYLSTLDSTGTMVLVKSKVKPRIQTPIVLILGHPNKYISFSLIRQHRLIHMNKKN